MGNACGNNTQTIVSKIPTVRIPVNILTDSLEISKSYLKLSCFSQDSGYLTVRFFVFEHGTVFIQDSTNPLPNQEYTLRADTVNKVVVRLNQAYIDSFIYEPFLPWPIAIEAKVGEVSQVIMVEIRDCVPYVIEKRVIIKGSLFSFRGISNAPVGNLRVCMVCCEEERKVIGLPCNDFSLCEKCAGKEQVKSNPRCPFCRECKWYAGLTSFVKILE